MGQITFTETPLAGAYVVSPSVHKDDRGWFFRSYCKREFESIGHHHEWVQMNHSFTRQRGSLRGMHYQNPPYSEIKLVRCSAGRVFDVIVDLRSGSPTFRHWFGVELSAENQIMLYIPTGFAHGFQTLTDDCEMLYCHSAYYTPGVEGGLRFDDPAIGIVWPESAENLSDRDMAHPYLTAAFVGLTL